ncbi:hypothetical protein JKP88DRAFT_296196 [Tribonema minus]|uniref:Centrosomal protein of 76 kDa n=1 Tax=Tribonema minus TaxID=303371 RepID=A0A835ZHM4_9STRA|nr:hypothetical protein JKP88DRAFT_296196 [Tribonema minus]
MLASARRELVGACALDWRAALVSDAALEVEVTAAAADAPAAAAGALRCRLDLVASPADAMVPLAAPTVELLMSNAHAAARSRARDFYLYCQRWWDELAQAGPAQSAHAANDSNVRLFAVDERGRRRCVCSFLPRAAATAAATGRLVHSPRHAARIVNLIPYAARRGVGGGGGGDSGGAQWLSAHTFLAQRRGGAAEHALLLAALLCGFGLDAYVCLGEIRDDDAAGAAAAAGGDAQPRRSSRAHAWVATYFGPHAAQRVTFWEPLTGARVAAPAHPFVTLSCVFNAQSLYANKQPDHRLAHTALDLGDAGAWKALAPERIAAAAAHDDLSADVALLPSPLDAAAAAVELEAALRASIAQHRAQLGLSTTFDDGLSYVLQAALAAYEAERVAGVAFGGAEFEDAVRRAVPDGHCFKGHPACFAHADPTHVFGALRAGALSGEILATVGDNTRFALRVQAHAYAEASVAVWVMLAVRYQPLRSL